MQKLKRYISLFIILCLFTTSPVFAAKMVKKIYASKATDISTGVYYIVPLANKNTCLSISKASKSTSVVPVLHKKVPACDNLWYIEKTGNGIYRIINYYSGLSLGAKNNTTAENGIIRQRSYYSLNSQKWYIINRIKYFIIQSSISQKVISIKNNSSNIRQPSVLRSFRKLNTQRWKLEKYKGNPDILGLSNEVSTKVTPKPSASTETKPSTTPATSVPTKTINGKRTLKSYLYNAMIPVGRTLYIWGGGWGGENIDSSVIGYQSSWSTFFNEHKSSDYDYTKYRYNYKKGLDCSGFAGWTIYNTLHTTKNQDWYVYSSTQVASSYASKGWCTLYKNGATQEYKPGDVVSMSGHVWISLGECSDGSVLLVHSSPKGVQISGTSGKAYNLANAYMKKYFPKWPYPTRQVGSSYLNYVGLARWKTSGVMKDPDGIQKMSAERVMKVLLGNP